MGVEYLDLPQHGVRYQHAGSRLAGKPVTSWIEGRSVKRIRVCGCGDDRKPGEYGKSIANRTTGTRCVRMQPSTGSNATHPWNNLTNGRWFDTDTRMVSKSLETNNSCRQTMSYGAADRKLAMASIL